MTAEYGIAAHWAYKENAAAGKAHPAELAIINKLNSWNTMDMGSGELLEEIKRELLKESIYVFTPQGDIVELPKGSTPIDFAYHIHTEIGNRCFGAKADGSIIALNEQLRNTQMIEILTSSTAHPHVNWLRHAKTARARSKIRHWINTHEDNLILERNIIAK
jgi:GTP pyrophosphokinase